MKVYFVGAGPGDPELLTVKAQKIINQAPVTIYDSSLVNPQILEGAQKYAQIHDSSRLHLDQVFAIYQQAYQQDKNVARIHPGDPSIYGAIGGQMTWLTKQGIPYEVIPGVSSFCAAAAGLQKELTAPGVSQTIILTRLRGRTPVIAKEDFVKLAKHQATMLIFFSAHQIDRLIVQLLEGGYTNQTPVAVIVKASWPTEKRIFTTIGELAWKVAQAGINKNALIIIGEVLRSGVNPARFHSPEFQHEEQEEA